MTWIRQTPAPPTPHACPKPTIEEPWYRPRADGRHGDLWRCDCGQLWQIRDTLTTDGPQWRPAGWWTRWRYRASTSEPAKLPRVLKGPAHGGPNDIHRQHSAALNSISWKIADALGYIPDIADQIAGDPEQLAQQLIDLYRDQRRRIYHMQHQRGQLLTATSIADTEDVTEWQRGYRSCSDHIRAALNAPTPEPPDQPIAGCGRADFTAEVSALADLTHEQIEAFLRALHTMGLVIVDP